jgi:two-component system nitrate/nitrite response regulator NarL
MTAESIRVVVVDDHPLILEGIQAQLEAAPHIAVVGKAARGEEVSELVGRLQPDVVLMDITLKGLNGIEATRTLTREGVTTAVIILTMHDDDEYVLQAAQAGARGYVLKSAEPQALVTAIEAVHRGETAFSPDVAEALLREVGGSADPTKRRLAPRERQVLALIAQGRINKEIADELSLSVRTVETYRERLMRKLELHTVAELTRYAVAEGIVSLE